MDHRAVFVGMDLGTFKTAVATAHGVREVIPTAVGKPKDHVARTLLGRDTVFGNDLTEHRLALDIIRPFEKGALKYLDGKDVKLDAARVAAHKEAARQVVEHAVAITRPPKGLPVFGVIGAVARRVEPDCDLSESFDRDRNTRPDAQACGFEGALAKAREVVLRVLDGCTLADFARRGPAFAGPWSTSTRERSAMTEAAKPGARKCVRRKAVERA